MNFRKDYVGIIILAAMLMPSAILIYTAVTYTGPVPTEICKNQGFDYNQFNVLDKVGDKTYISCCNETIGEDTCEWVERK